jgi:hypothetical protein
MTRDTEQKIYPPTQDSMRIQPAAFQRYEERFTIALRSLWKFLRTYVRLRLLNYTTSALPPKGKATTASPALPVTLLYTIEFSWLAAAALCPRG